MKDPYEVLGVARTAAPDDVRKAYRRLAKKLHPDLNPGDKQAEARFKDVAAANDLLSDPDKRQRFDSGEIDASGAERPRQQFYKDFASGGTGAGSPYENSSGYADFGEGEDLFAELFRRQTGRARRTRGADLHYRLAISFLDAVNGATQRLTLPEGGSLDVTIPAGIQESQTLRLRGKGAPSRGEGEAGDALVEISINPHRFFIRQDDDIHIELPITLSEAVLGARVKTPTPTGAVMLTVPKGSNTGTLLRLKGKGVARRGGQGDELVKLKVMLPSEPNAELEAFLSTWSTASSHDPRKDMVS
ncbi:MAG: DnaJ C-terminal domain-containing protein [Terricaulis sp.]